MTDEAGFRQEVRACLETHLPQEMRFTSHLLDNTHEGPTRFWHRLMADKGWIAPSWPKEYGGTGWSDRQTRIFQEECARVGAPRPSEFGLALVGPVIYTFGTPEQKARHLPAILDGSVLWCQGYSEPGAGSDLAALKCAAVRDGEDYVINGQKIWTSHAHWTDWMFCLVRTRFDGKPQAGITFLLIDMKTPGIEVRPIRSIDGMHHLNEVYFTDVRVPVSNRIGEENNGWTYAKVLLANERTNVAGTIQASMALAETRRYLNVLNEEDRAAFRQKVCALEMRLSALETMEARAVAAAGTGAENATVPVTLKTIGSELQQDIAELKVEMLGHDTHASRETGGRSIFQSNIGSGESAGLRAMQSYMFGRAITIYGGSTEIQKNIMAKLIGL